MGDFNVSMDDKFKINFCELNDLSSLIDKPTCYKNFDKPKCIDLILTNKPSYFQHNNVFETGLSDFHLLTVTEFKIGFQKLKPQVITYLNYKNFNNDRFQAEIKTCGFDAKDINSFKETILSVKVTDNKTFWRTVVPTFSNKNSKNDKIILNEEGKTVSDEKELCRTFNTYFANIVSDLQIPKIQEDASNIRSNHDTVLAAINTFQNYPSVVNIKQRESNSTFSFKNTNENEVRKIIKNLNVRKTCQGSDIPTKIIKLNTDLFSSFICQNFSYCVIIGKFPN